MTDELMETGTPSQYLARQALIRKLRSKEAFEKVSLNKNLYFT
jgi:hypothetical protein